MNTNNMPGMTVSPIMSDDVEGEQQLLDFQVSTSFDIPTSQYNDFVYDSESGEYQHRYSDIDPQVEEWSDLDAQYESAVLEANPSLPEAIQWASNGGLSDELIDEFNNAMESGDPELMMPAVDFLLQNFEEANGELEYADYDEDDSDDELIPPEDEYIDPDDLEVAQDFVAELNEVEPNFDLVPDLESHAAAALDANDPAVADAALLSAQFHAGDISAQDAINYMVDNYNFADLVRVVDLLG